VTVARIGGYGRGVRLALAGVLLAFSFALWFARPAHANCAVDPSDPMCMPSNGGGSSNATSPPETAPPINRSTPTQPPVNRGTQPAENPGAGFTPGAGNSYTPPVPEGTNFGPDNVTPPDTPTIATNGQAPPTGGGTAASSAPALLRSSNNGAPTGAIALGLALAAGLLALSGLAAGPPPPQAPPQSPPPLASPVAGFAGGGLQPPTSDWYVYKSGLDNHFAVAKLWEGGTIQLPGVQIMFGPSTFVDCWAFVAANAVDSGPYFHAPGTPPLGFMSFV
jgi:hypothetical protein